MYAATKTCTAFVPGCYFELLCICEIFYFLCLVLIIMLLLFGSEPILCYQISREDRFGRLLTRFLFYDMLSELSVLLLSLQSHRYLITFVGTWQASIDHNVW